MQNQTKKVSRIYFLDELRAIAVIAMIFYHAFYTLAVLFNMKTAWDLLIFFTPIEPLIALTFIVLSGISSRLSTSNLKRGVKLLLISLALTAVTVIFDYFTHSNSAIYFGVLHMLACSIIIYALIEKFLNKINPVVGMIVFIFLFLLTYNLARGYIGVENFKIELPDFLYQTNFLFMIGLPNNEFTSADYFSIFPWTFIFIAGTFIGKFAKENKFPKWTFVSRSKPLQFIGKHALIIYIVHQPIIYGIALIIDKINM